MIFIGDTHGLRPIFDIIDKRQYSGMNLIHVGDFGLGFNDIGRDINNLFALDDALGHTGNNLYVIRGNHDNPIFWDKSLGLNLPKFHNLHLMSDYSVRYIENRNVLFVGGAMSIDRAVREDDKPYPTWWKGEEFKLNEAHLKWAIQSLNAPLDIVVTHTAPHFVHPIGADNYIVNSYHEVEKMHGRNLKKGLEEERKSVSELYNILKIRYNQIPKYWFYGHFHDSKQQIIHGTNFKLLNINETYEV